MAEEPLSSPKEGQDDNYDADKIKIKIMEMDLKAYETKIKELTENTEELKQTISK